MRFIGRFLHTHRQKTFNCSSNVFTFNAFSQRHSDVFANFFNFKKLSTWHAYWQFHQQAFWKKQQRNNIIFFCRESINVNNHIDVLISQFKGFYLVYSCENHAVLTTAQCTCAVQIILYVLRHVRHYIRHVRWTQQRQCFYQRLPTSFLLWSPYGIGQTIIFSCCGLFFFFLLLFFLA